MELTFLNELYEIDGGKSIAFFLILNALLWFKFCKRLRAYSLKQGRNPLLSMVISYSPMIVFPLILGFLGFVLKSSSEELGVLKFIIFAVLFFVLFGSYLITLFWYGGIKSPEQVDHLNGK